MPPGMLQRCNMKKIINKLILLAVLAAMGIGFHAGFLYGSPYVHYRMFKNSAEAIIKYNLRDIDELKTRLLESAKENKVELSENTDLSDPYGIFIYSDRRDSYDVKMNWSVYVDYYGYYPKTFEYTVEVSK